MSQEIILYDLPSRGRPTCWSLNPWKARLILNYKSLPYTTTWLEYPSIQPTLSALGIPPNPPTTNPVPYSIPALRLPSGAHIMDSHAIAHALESAFPSPSLHLDDPALQRTQAAAGKLSEALRPLAIPRVPERVLNPASEGYFRATRAERLGMTLEEYAGTAGEEMWAAAREGLEAVVAVLGERGEGPFVRGREASFADFVLAGLWAFYARLDEGGDLFGRVMGFDERLRTHYEACKVWLERDD